MAVLSPPVVDLELAAVDIVHLPASIVIQRPAGLGAFQFVTLAALRAVQLTRGCRPRVDGVHKKTIIAQLEVSQGKVIQDLTPLSGVANGSANGGSVAIERAVPAAIAV